MAVGETKFAEAETPPEDVLHQLSDAELNDLAFKFACAKRKAEYETNPPPPYLWDYDYVNNLSKEKKKAFAKAILLHRYYNQHLLSATHFGFVFPQRTKENLVLDKPTGTYVLGPKKKVVTSRNINHLKTIARILWFNDVVIRLIAEGDVSSLRGIYYWSMNEEHGGGPHTSFEVTKKDHEREGPIAAANFVAMMESLYGVPHEAFGILPDHRGAVFGDAGIEYVEPPSHAGKHLRLDAIPDGVPATGSLALANITSCNAERIIVVEKGEIFDKMVVKGLDKRYNAILVNSGGTGSTSAKLVVKKFVDQFKLLPYLLVDADPWGLHIARTWMVGSAKNGHLRTAIPSAKFLGMTAKDIIEYGLKRIPLDAQDKHRIRTLLGDPRYKDDARWRQYLLDYVTLGAKTELQAFTQHGLGFLTDTYLPTKMEAAGG